MRVPRDMSEIPGSLPRWPPSRGRHWLIPAAGEAGGGALTAPRVVRRVDEVGGAARADLSNEIREDVLPADRRPDHDRTGGEDRIVDRGNERAECGNDRPRPRHSTRQRLILGERHQHHLTIVTGDL